MDNSLCHNLDVRPAVLPRVIVCRPWSSSDAGFEPRLTRSWTMLTPVGLFAVQMNPLADVSISGTNLLAHGRPELMNAVMITSMAASTFNSQLDAWEPAVEPWEGLVKWESNNDPSEQALPAGSRLRVAASSVVNVNVSSSCVETLVAAQLAWKRNAELEEDARKELQLVSTAKPTEDADCLRCERRCSTFLRLSSLRWNGVAGDPMKPSHRTARQNMHPCC